MESFDPLRLRLVVAGSFDAQRVVGIVCVFIDTGTGLFDGVHLGSGRRGWFNHVFSFEIMSEYTEQKRSKREV